MQKIIAILIMLTCLQATAQKTKSISGSVKNTRNEELAGAAIKLLKAPDSALIKGETANAAGKFQFNNLQDGNYILVISSVGHKKFTSSPVTIDEAHHTIVLPVIFFLLPELYELLSLLLF